MRSNSGLLTDSGLFGSDEIEFLLIFDNPSFIRYLGFDYTNYMKQIMKVITITAAYEPKNPSQTNLLFVYSDIVRENHVGDSMSNCLSDSLTIRC